jgi:DNA-binding response OmpR family regulator
MGARELTSSGQTVLLVEPDATVRKGVTDYLVEEHGLAVTSTGMLHIADAAIRADAAAFDALIINVSAPDGDACSLCARLRSDGHDVVIIMTGRDEEVDIVRALDAGANDYVTQPFRLHELFARLRTQWRISDGGRDAAYPLGPYLFKPSAKALCDPAGTVRVPLTAKEVAILKFLFLSEGRPVGRKELLRKVWGYNDGMATHTVETHVHRLRQKIETSPRHPALLLSDRDGYRINLADGAAEGE